MQLVKYKFYFQSLLDIQLVLLIMPVSSITGPTREDLSQHIFYKHNVRWNWHMLYLYVLIYWVFKVPDTKEMFCYASHPRPLGP